MMLRAADCNLYYMLSFQAMWGLLRGPDISICLFILRLLDRILLPKARSYSGLC